MSSSFAFVPRAVSKDKKKNIQHAHAQTLYSVPTPTPYDITPNFVSGKGKTKSLGGTSGSLKAKCSDEDYANVIHLAVSDYALWLDPDLRRVVDQASTPEPGQQAKDGFIALSYLLESSKILAPLQLQDSQTLIVKALRSCASDVVDVRLLVSEPSSSIWFGRRDNIKDAGGYEIRRKDWVDGASRRFEGFSKAYWEKHTIYVEHIPLQYRTIPGITRFLLSLLSTNVDGIHETRIQDITLLSHHQDKAGDHPTCKGFALVVLQSPSDVEFLLHRWPWDRNVDLAQSETEALAESSDAQEASKFGFRTLPKARWDELREEYLTYRKKLVDELNALEDAEVPMHVPSTLSEAQEPSKPSSSRNISDKVDDVPMIDLSSPYPINSLVFVRNVHSETNKTTLRKLFSAAFVAPLANGVVRGDGLDYVDFNRGMDSCYIRFATPNHAQILIRHFLTNSVSQSNSLDDTGTAPDSGSSAIAVELVVGKREEFYWEKVPEKIRRKAVENAVGLMCPLDTASMGNDDADQNSERRKRKRRKH